jgi:uncharacterized protein YabN with tetrapyrrole methylase and pyrophosphatase domain
MRLVVEAPVVRLRTRVHPAALELIDVLSYDQWYEEAASFEELYLRIAEDLSRLAASSPSTRSNSCERVTTLTWSVSRRFR